MKRPLIATFLVLLAFVHGPLLPTQGDELRIVAEDPAGNGLLAESSGKTILFVSGSPEQMGQAHGTLLKPRIAGLVNTVLYVVGTGYSVAEDDWFFTRMDEIRERTMPHTPERFVREIDALSAAAGIRVRDGRAANFFPELFHCSGIAVRGAATADGGVIHARVLDYMRDIDLQNFACVQVFLPDTGNAWMSLGYAGFIGTVTAMNEKGLAIGEMGGGGEGKWDGCPMNFLLRDVMERASTVKEGSEILERTPRTCEYYYVLSDRNRDMAGVACTPDTFEVLLPGKQHERLPLVPEDAVLISGGDRAQHISDRLREHYGKIDVPLMIEIIKRPVAMSSNLHNAIFKAETLEMWCADAGRDTVACDEPYARFDLDDLLAFYRSRKAAVPAGQ